MYLVILMFVARVVFGQAAEALAGRWAGKIFIPEREVSIVIDLAKNGAGAWIGLLTIPGSPTADVPLGTIALDKTIVRFSAMLPKLTSFEGTLSGSTLAGTVSSVDGSVPFNLSRTGDVSVKVPAPSTALPKEFAGTWEATIERNGTQRTVLLVLKEGPDGLATGTLASRAGGATQELPLTRAAIERRDLRIEVRIMSGSFSGTLNDKGELTGEWTEPTQRVTLTFKRQ
jgi:hypothetical protein